MQLHISAGRHCKPNPEKRVQDVLSRFDELDVVFMENREPPASKRTRLVNWVLAPLLLSAIVGWAIFKGSCAALLGSDKEIAERLAAHYETPVIRVDKSVHEIVSEPRQLRAVSNWGLLAPPVLLTYINLGLVEISILFAGYFSIVLMASFVAGSMNDGNIEILHQIETISSRESYERGCIITGGDHESGLSKFASFSDHVHIAD